MELAPICLFTYKRLDNTIQTVEALKKNKLAAKSKLFIFSDGPKRETDAPIIEKVRAYLDTIDGFQEIIIDKKEKNQGLANSIIAGVSKVIDQFQKVIVLEDDLVSSENFLDYMNAALETYQNNDAVFSISGYTFPVSLPEGYDRDVYFSPRSSSWGWASWKDRWEKVDWDVKDFPEFWKNRNLRKKFSQGGSDLNAMLKKQIDGKIDSWAIRWTYDQFRKAQYTVFPTISKIQNIGFGDNASHTKGYNRFATPLDESDKTEFNFAPEIILNPRILKSFRHKYSLRERIRGRLIHYLNLG